tara:strand:- start:982 stop:1899 length:918 start_codon:yes stop_codon:yes gene_type:complete
MLVKNRWRVRPGLSPTLLLLAACSDIDGCPTSKRTSSSALIAEVMADVPSREFKQQSDGSFLGKIPENEINVENLLGTEVSRLWSSYEVTIIGVTVVNDSTATFQVSNPLGTATMTFTLGGVDGHLFRLMQSGSRDAMIQFKQRPDYEQPQDADGNNIFEATVQARMPGVATERSNVKIVVTNLADGATNVPSPSSRPSVPAHSRENDVIRIEVCEGASEVFLFNSDRLSTFLGNLFAGADADKFTVKRVLSGGEQRTLVEFRQAPDASAPTDQGRDNIYNFDLAETPAAILGDLSFEVTVVCIM